MAAPFTAGRATVTGQAAGAVLSSEQADILFWRRHAQLGLALSSMVVVVVAAYAEFAVRVPHRTLLAALVTGGAVLTITAALIAPWAIRREWSRASFFAWSMGSALFILAGAAADGGDESPIAAALFLPLLFAALAYPFLAVLALGVAEAGGYAVVALTDSTPSASYALVALATLLIATVMAAMSARNREEQRAQLDSLAGRLRALADRDPLTGCLNRRGFQEALDLELARTARHGRPLALLIVDVDHLKDINDGRGHAAGDAALVRAGLALAAAGRVTDIVARVGGDEFAVLAPETDESDAVNLAVRVHQELRRESGEPPITVSIGVAATASAVPAADLFRAADTALYAAKRAGRDCTRARRLDAGGAVRVPPTRRRSESDVAVTSRPPVR
jgi:diguanylate cyclase (GGDEF)-like protein